MNERDLAFQPLPGGPWIDLRSDACSQPTWSIRQAMLDAETGNDDFGEDPTVRRLEEESAALLGKEAAVFAHSGTMCNLMAVMAHLPPGGKILTSRNFHIFDYEERAMRRVARCDFAFIADHTTGAETRLSFQSRIQSSDPTDPSNPSDAAAPPPSLLCLENTINRLGGTIMAPAHMSQLLGWAHASNMAVHLDGARFFNAAAALGVEPSVIAAGADTVMTVFTKALAAPEGAILAGPKERIAGARRFRWMLGGSCKQGGMIAGGCLMSLATMRERIPEDHANARRLAEGLASFPAFEVNLERVATNIVFFRLKDPAVDPARLRSFLLERGAKIGRIRPDGLCRLVTHKDIDVPQIDRFLELMPQALASSVSSHGTPNA